MRMDPTAFLDELIADSFQTRAHAVVENPVVYFHYQSPQQLWIDADRQDRLTAKLVAQLAAQALLLLVVQGDGGCHLDVHASAAALEKIARQDSRLAEDAETIVVVEDEQKTVENVVDLAFEGAAQCFALVFAADDGAGEKEGEGGIAGKNIANQFLQLFQHFLRLVLFVGGSQQCFRIDAGDLPGGVVQNSSVMSLVAVGHDGSFIKRVPIVADRCWSGAAPPTLPRSIGDDRRN